MAARQPKARIALEAFGQLFRDSLFYGVAIAVLAIFVNAGMSVPAVLTGAILVFSVRIDLRKYGALWRDYWDDDARDGL